MSTNWTQEAGLTGQVDTDNLQDIVDQAEAHATDSENSATASANSATSSASSASSASTSATNAANSASSASTSATSASTSATNASNSATSASTSATNAANSATAAASSATEAETSATNAASSESSVEANATAAAVSESNASTSETNAANSATSAANSATSAATSASGSASSATAAATSESNASTSETNAATSASNASTSETNAATSASTASTAATTASTKASEASTSASNASTSETNAASSASTATTKASEASISATAAASSATAAASSATESANSATASAGSATSASESETAAATSETNAANSATAAANSATSASSSASAASTSATSAATSASNASTSETNAATSETNAATSETNAANSASAASTSETNASASASSASTSASNASTSEANAATSASQAATSASNASSSETNAATSATTATTKASEASTSATNAATSESNAAGSASAAASSASSASASADAALAALDSFDDRYLGQKASDPTLDNDGNALITGALYFNTTDDVMKVYEGSVWVAAYASLSGALLQANNLSDLQSATAARTNLGLGSAATTASTAYATAAQGALADTALQSFTETDPVFTAWDRSTGISITESQISDFGSYQPAGSYEPAFTKNTAFNKNFGTAAGTVAQGNDSRINNGQTAYGWGDHGAEGYLTGNQAITLTGDVSGSGTTSIAVTIADDSHNHTIANVDGLQSALDGKVDDSQVLTNVPAGAVFTDTVYSHPTYAGDDFSVDTGALTGATVVSDIDINVTTDSLGHVTDANGTVSTRTLTLANLGYTGATNANYYTHPSYAGDDFSIDTGPLTGATVISDIDINVTTDTLGHVTDANASVATRNLTLANLGFTGDSNANYFTYTHPSTHAASMITTVDEFANSNSTNVQDVLDDLDAAISGKQAAGTYNTVIGTDSDINTSGSTIIDNIYVTDGVITSMGTRTLTAGDIGAANSSHTHSYLPLSGGSLSGSLSVTGSITASGDVTAYSDERLKSDIHTIPNALEKLTSLRGVNYIKDGKESTGVIAQEVEKVLPEVVHTAEDEMQTKSVAYGNMIGLLIEAVKELTKRVEELESK